MEVALTWHPTLHHCFPAHQLNDREWKISPKPNGFQMVFSKRRFSDSSPRLSTDHHPFRGSNNARKHQCFKAFWCLLPLRILTTLWTHHSEKHRLENTVCYSFRSFSHRSFLRGRQRGMSVPKCLSFVSRIWRAWPKFWGTSGRKLPLLADFLFL